MRNNPWLLVVALVLVLVLDGTCQDKKTQKRLDYLVNVPLLVSLPEQDPKALIDKLPEEITQSNKYFNSLNRNIRLAMDTFWDLSSEVNYVPIDSIKTLMKSREEAIFLLHQVKVYGNKKEDEETILSFRLTKANKSTFFDGVIYLQDSGFVDISTKFRLFRLSVLGENLWSPTSISDKSIIYVDDVDTSMTGEEYLSEVKAKYRTRVQPIGRHDLVNLILTRSSKHILVSESSAYYLKDGKMVALIY